MGEGVSVVTMECVHLRAFVRISPMTRKDKIRILASPL